MRTQEHQAIHQDGVADETNWDALRAMSPEDIRRQAREDPDNPLLTPEQLAQMVPTPNAKAIREHLGVTQKEFAQMFRIALGTLREWEQGVRHPDSAARAYLQVIDRDPDAVRAALNPGDRAV